LNYYKLVIKNYPNIFVLKNKKTLNFVSYYFLFALENYIVNTIIKLQSYYVMFMWNFSIMEKR